MERVEGEGSLEAGLYLTSEEDRGGRPIYEWRDCTPYDEDGRPRFTFLDAGRGSAAERAAVLTREMEAAHGEHMEVAGPILAEIRAAYARGDAATGLRLSSEHRWVFDGSLPRPGEMAAGGCGGDAGGGQRSGLRRNRNAAGGSRVGAERPL